VAKEENPYLTNYKLNVYFWIFFEIIKISAILDGHQYPKKNLKEKVQKFKKNYSKKT
jgi:hypothetical protein